jgi:hypothetical protein
MDGAGTPAAIPFCVSLSGPFWEAALTFSTTSPSTMISPIRFAGALSLLLAAVVNVDAAAHPHDLTNAAMSATKKVPALRSKDVQRKSRYGDIIRSLKIKQTRSLEDAAEEGDGGEDYEADGEDADYDWGNYQNEDAGFAMSDYSFKYTGCSTVQTWSDDLAGYGGEDNILVSKRFATFRLCEDCSDSSGTGCNNNYGEYVVSMDQFLLAMTDFNEERVIGYCEYCQTCAGIEAFKSFVTEAAELKNTSLSANYEVYEQWMTDNGIEEDDQNSAAEQYYTYVRYGNSGSNANNGGNYANNYQNGNYNSNYQSSSNGYSSQQWWSNVGNKNNGEDGGNNSGNSNYKQQDWSFGNYGTTFMGVQVLPGYYDADGVFVAAWGYMSATEDVGYVSLEEDDNMSVWIELFGELPEGWDENWAQDGGEVESCNFDYAGSCYSQYASCMLILGDEDFTQAYEETYGEMVKMADFLECTAVDWDGQDKSMYQYYSNSNTGEGEEKQQQECEDCEEQSVYVGPSCSNGKTIKLAVYSDQYCSQLTDLTVQQVLGDVLMDDDSEGSPIDMIPNTCISCLASVSAIRSIGIQLCEIGVCSNSLLFLLF